MVFDVPLERLRQRRSVKWRAYPDDVLPLWVAEMDVSLAAPVRDVLVRMAAASDTGYAWPAGLPEAYAGFAARRWGLPVDPATTYVLQDVMRGVLEVLQVATEPGDGIVVNPPVYQPFFATIAHARRRVVEVPLLRDGQGRAGLDLDGLEAAFRAGARCYLLCSPHNPVGRAWTAAELGAVAALADRYGVLVLADEIHAPLVHAPHRFVPFASLEAQSARDAVSFVSASKAWNLAGLKCALVVASTPGTWRTVRSMGREVGYGTGILGVAAATAAYQAGEPWLAGLLAALDHNRHLLAALLRAHLPDVGLHTPEATCLAWLDCRPLDLADPYRTFLHRGRVALEAGAKFGTGGEGFVRLNFGTSPEVITQAVQRMAAAL